jgi:hypothetical protein
MPACVPAPAVAKAGDVPDEDLIRAEGVAVRATGEWLGYPLSVGRLDELPVRRAVNPPPLQMGGFRPWRGGRLTAGMYASALEVRDLAPVSLVRGVGLIPSTQEPCAPHQRSHRSERQNEDQPDD